MNDNKGFKNVTNERFFIHHDSNKALEEAYKEWLPDVLSSYVRNNLKETQIINKDSFLAGRGDVIFYTECKIGLTRKYWKDYLNIEFVYKAEESEMTGRTFKLIGVESYALADDIPQTKFGLLCKYK